VKPPIIVLVELKVLSLAALAALAAFVELTQNRVHIYLWFMHIGEVFSKSAGDSDNSVPKISMDCTYLGNLGLM
jgi:hypothetical protein